MKARILPYGAKATVEVSAIQVIDLEIDCGCWGHRRNFTFQIVTTNVGSSYVRGGGNEGAHKAIDQDGPIVVRVVSSKKAE